MKNKIKENINSPDQLEQLYRSDKRGFTKAFLEIYPDISDNKIADFWKLRLDHSKDDQSSGKIKNDLFYLILSCLIAGFLIKIPQIFGFDPSIYPFYERNAGLIVFLGLVFYSFLTKAIIKPKQIIMTLTVFIVLTVYVNSLPLSSNSNSINLVYLHLPLLLWCLYGLIHIDFDLSDRSKLIDYLKHNGDLAILSAIILIAGGILTAVTFGLFFTIGLNIDEFYFNYVIVWGLVSVLIVATFIIQRFPSIANKIAPVIANIFSPLVLITLLVYVFSILITGKSPYNDRDFLLVFNIMLLGVMAIITFSISENHSNKKINNIILFLLSILALIIDLVALSAIVYRLGEFGFTPNRIAVLGSNLLILGNLIMIILDLYLVNFKNKNVKRLDHTIANYLPIYAVWILFVVLGFPLIFGFK